MADLICQRVQDGPKMLSIKGDFLEYIVGFEAAGVGSPRRMDFIFWVQLEIPESFLAQGSWPDIPQEHRLLYYYQFIREGLKDGAPPEPDQVIQFTLDTQIEDQQFCLDPSKVYTLEKIHPDQRFTISSKPQGVGH